MHWHSKSVFLQVTTNFELEYRAYMNIVIYMIAIGISGGLTLE